MSLFRFLAPALGTALLAAPIGGHAQGAPAAARTTAGFTALTDRTTPTGPLATLVTLDGSSRALSAWLNEIAKQAKLSFAFDATQRGMDRAIAARISRVTAAAALVRVLDGSPFEALVGPAGQIVITKRSLDARRDSSATASAAELVRLSGYVRNASSTEVIRHATITVDGDVTRRESNEDGFYALALPAGSHRLRVRSIGYSPFDSVVTLDAQTGLDIGLQPTRVVLQAVSITAASPDRPDLDPRTPDMSVNRLDLSTVKVAPAVLGESDPLRSLTLLPGVSLNNDASTAFSVRGGTADQNLILLDESTIYNPSHLLGFLSTFNTDAVDDVTLYKGAIPAKFGGRLSSVVDVRQREGNANRFRGSASIGLLSSRVSLEGPLPFARGSYMLAGRRSYADAFLRFASDTSLRNNTAYFYDVNAKANIRLGSTGSLLVSGYLGRDRFINAGEFGAGWGNKAATIRWNQAFRGRLFSKVTGAWSDYDYRLDLTLDTRDSLKWVAGIQNSDLKVDEQLHLDRFGVLEFGAQLTGQTFRPADISPVGQSQVVGRHLQKRDALSSGTYIGHEVDLGARLSMRYGVRWAGFARIGPATTYRYANDAPLIWSNALGRYETGRVLDSTVTKPGDVLRSYSGAEPRASARLMLTEHTALKASYSRTQQFIQLVTNSNSPTPLDIWEPAGRYIRPQVGDQVALGYSATLGGWELSAEGYVRKAKDVVDYIDGADLVFNERVETILVQGEGRARGLELLARRSEGRLSGWVSYTLSKSEQRFPVPASAGAIGAAGINGGRWYVSPTDKTHNLTAVGVYEFSPRWTFSSTFALASGLPTTLPSTRYSVDGLLLAEYAPRNSSRLPLYHRLDVNWTRRFRNGELQFGVINAYNRFNAQSLGVRQQTKNPLVTEAIQTSVFGAVPSINYVFRF